MGQTKKRICPRCGGNLRVRSVPTESTPEVERISRYIFCDGDKEAGIKGCAYNKTEQVTILISEGAYSIEENNYFDSVA